MVVLGKQIAQGAADRHGRPALLPVEADGGHQLRTQTLGRVDAVSRDGRIEVDSNTVARSMARLPWEDVTHCSAAAKVVPRAGRSWPPQSGRETRRAYAYIPPAVEAIRQHWMPIRYARPRRRKRGSSNRLRSSSENSGHGTWSRNRLGVRTMTVLRRCR